MEELQYWIWLNAVDGIGSRRFFQLLERFHSPKAVWEASVEELKNIRGLNRDVVLNIDRSRKEFNLDAEIRAAKHNDVSIIPYTDEKYPNLLRAIYDPPPLIYVKGNADILKGVCVSVVGSRKATVYGQMATRKLVCGLVQYGLVIVSGLARGIDTFAHETALTARGTTVAVLGSGIDVCYPSDNKRLFDKICSQGAVISTYPFGTQPRKQNFPARNRLISGMSLGTLVVEAGERSGALITADFALEQGREVFAVPGSILSSSSSGTNHLIKQGARVVVDSSDIIEELGLSSSLTKQCESISGTNRLSLQEMQVLDVLCLEPKHIDSVARDSGLSINEVSSNLIRLELAGRVKGLPGQMFARVY